MSNGHFVISLDFELFWGVFDSRTIENYGPNILGIQKAIPAMLDLFNEFNIKVTFATVGFLFARDKQHLMQFIPSLKPSYTEKKLSPYTFQIEMTGKDEYDDPYHFAYTLLYSIKEQGHEIGSHTFSHFYALEEGQTIEEFRADLKAAVELGKENNIFLKSFVFPRNQYNNEYLQICKESGFTNFRGNENSWLYYPKSKEQETKLRRALRLIDAYFNISGHHTYTFSVMKKFPLINIPASRFLRPFNPKLKIIEGLRLKRILKSMTYAAINNETYHLWWHPHNFGINTTQNINFLKKILNHYLILNQKYGFSNITMGDLAEKIIQYEK